MISPQRARVRDTASASAFLHLRDPSELRSGDNPYAGQRNQLTRRQMDRKRRLMAHVKQAKKRKQQKR